MFVTRIVSRGNRLSFGVCCLSFLLSSISGAAEPDLADAPQHQLWTIRPNGTELRLLTNTPGYFAGSPDWSPDGKLIAYDTWVGDQGFEGSQVAVIRADGTDRRLLGPGAMPSWSPDGTQLVCHTYDSPQTIIVMNADGTGRETILDHWGSPRWSPRGNYIASISRDRTIAVFDCATGVERTILRGPYSLNQGFSISPDGLRFCFSNAEGGVALATLNEKTMRANVRWLVRTGNGFHSSWSPDGKRIAFNWRPEGEDSYRLYLLDVDSKDEPTLLPGQHPDTSSHDPDWSPDGKWIVFRREVVK